MTSDPSDRLSSLPPAHALLETPAAKALAQLWPHDAVRAAVRRVLASLREELLAGRAEGDRSALTERAAHMLDLEARAAALPRLRRVINATGVVLHTNLGRAPLGHEIVEQLAAAVTGYATLEYDLANGRRGHRDRLISALCASLVGAEDALVVNNNAAAVLLTATALAAGRDVIVSRGELVEIGGGFRVPDILAACGARLVEVGTTNRTRIADYDRAISPSTSMLLKVHRSNFTLVGFVEEPTLRELVTLGQAQGVPVVEDLGSGAMVDTRALGLPEEPTARGSIAAGVDLVMFSGDKLLGGPQAGILVGRSALIERLRKHPLARALRPGRLVFAALEATLRIYAQGREAAAIPVVAMLAESSESVRVRASRLCDAVRSELGARSAGVTLRIEASEARVGGGAMPAARVASWAMVLEPGSDARARAIERGLRTHADTPVIARLAAGRIVFDARTLADEDVAVTARGLARAIEQIQEMADDGPLPSSGEADSRATGELEPADEDG